MFYFDKVLCGLIFNIFSCIYNFSVVFSSLLLPILFQSNLFNLSRDKERQ